VAEIPVFVINLDRSPDRMEFMREQGRELGMEMHRISGVDGRKNLPQSLQWQFSSGVLPQGKIGCYASHLVALQQFMETGHQALILLEDDITLGPDFYEVARAAIFAAPPGWDIIQLASNFKNPCHRLSALQNGKWLVRHSRLPAGSAALALSREGAQKLLNPRKRMRTFDLEIRYGWVNNLDIFGVSPPPAEQFERFESLIGPHHAEDKHLRRQWRPGLLSQIYGALYVKAKLGLTGTLRCWVGELARAFRRATPVRQ
jgi:glycosyl transferase, family 25